jgi:antitoxin ParD1/3/4
MELSYSSWPGLSRLVRATYRGRRWRGWAGQAGGQFARIGLKGFSISPYTRAMQISLTSEQQAWIDARVASGVFASAEDAVRQLLDDRIADLSIEEDDLAWAKPLVDEALAQVDSGEFLTREEHRARTAALLASFND